MSNTATTEQPRTERQELILSGDAFAERQAAVPAKTEPEAPETDLTKTAPEKKEDAPEKKDETAAAKPDEKAKGTTPLDVAPAAKEEKKEPAVDAEIAELLKSEPPANASASSKANHAAMRKGLERANGTIQKLTADLKESQGKVAVVPADVQERLTAAETAVKDRDALIERVAFERSPRFQKFITEGEAELTTAKSYLEGSEINPNIVDLAARTAGAKRVALLTESGMEPNVVAAVLSNLSRADAINRDRDAAQENWKATRTEWEAEQDKTIQAKATQVRVNEERVFQDVGKQMAETLLPFQREGGDEKWQADVDGRWAEAKEYFEGKKTLAETSQIIYEGLAGRVYKSAFEDLRVKYNEQVEENGRIRAARPGAADSSADTATPVTSGDPMKIAGDSFDANRAKRGL